MAEHSKKQRLDREIVERGLVPTRARARDVILRGVVQVDGAVATKAGQLIGPDTSIIVDEAAARYVSRGAVKLIAALDAFRFDVNGRNALDIGASTGGFTQVLLERRAAHVTAVDVGRDQLASEIRHDSRVKMLEGMDSRKLTPDHLAHEITAIVADVSFISLTKALPAVLGLASSGCWLVALIKPQFEVGREGIGKGGIVRDDTQRQNAVVTVCDWLASQPGWSMEGVIRSPVEGGDGNIEFLAGARYDQ